MYRRTAQGGWSFQKPMGREGWHGSQGDAMKEPEASGFFAGRCFSLLVFLWTGVFRADVFPCWCFSVLVFFSAGIFLWLCFSRSVSISTWLRWSGSVSTVLELRSSVSLRFWLANLASHHSGMNFLKKHRETIVSCDFDLHMCNFEHRLEAFSFSRFLLAIVLVPQRRAILLRSCYN